MVTGSHSQQALGCILKRGFMEEKQSESHVSFSEHVAAAAAKIHSIYLAVYMFSGVHMLWAI